MIKESAVAEMKDQHEACGFWIDCDDGFDYEDPPRDMKEIHALIGLWEKIHLFWVNVGPNSFSCGDKIILVTFHNRVNPSLPFARMIEVMDTGSNNTDDPNSDMSHYIAFEDVHGTSRLSIDQLLELRSRGLINGLVDLTKRRKLSLEEWNKFVTALELSEDTGEELMATG